MKLGAHIRTWAWILWGLMASGAAAQTVTGSFTATSPARGLVAQGTFSCSGTGPCVGTYALTTYPVGCSNSIVTSDQFTLSGVNVTQPGAFVGTILMRNALSDEMQHPNGTCTVTTRENLTVPITGSSDGANATFTAAITTGDGPVDIAGSFRATAPPPFEMTVSSQIDAQTATVTAAMQFRPADVGTSQSVYVFAVAPQNLVQPASLSDPMPPLAKARGPDGSKADAVACVLAQLNAQGQLVAVSASSMRAYVTGVLSGQGQAVTILNGTPTVAVGGTTFYVGYGTSAQAMLNTGTNRNTATVPGSKECRPQPPQKGWWWQPQPSANERSPRDGTGYSIEAQGDLLFFAAFLYDASGRSSWYVASGKTSIDGSLFTGDLLQASGGQSLGGTYRPFSAVNIAGPITLTFDSESTGTLSWPGGTFPIGRFNIVPNRLAAAARPGQPESGWWWNPAESGRGFFIEWQDGWADLAGYMYDDDGNPVWYITVVQTPDPMRLTGTWWSFGNGMTLTGEWRPHQLVNGNVAPVSITFTSATTAVMTLPGGRTTNLQRHRF